MTSIEEAFTLLGFTPDPNFVERIAVRTACMPQTFTVPSGTMFLCTTYGDLATTETALALKLGPLRDGESRPLSAAEILQRAWLTPKSVDAEHIQGNGTAICLSKHAPQISAYMTLLSVAQLYYTRLGESFVVADSPRVLLRLSDHVSIDERAIPYHFLFRLVPGRRTYFAGISRLLPGEWLSWQAGRVQVKLLRDLQESPSVAASEASQRIFSHLQHIVTETPERSVTFLSGGVDSSLIQLALQQATSSPPPTFSYVMHTPAYDAESHYISAAQRSLQTRHTVVDVTPEMYLDLLNRTIERASYPSLCVETDPCIEALLSQLDKQAPETQICFAGHGADALFGLGIARKLALLQIAQKIPRAATLLNGVAVLFPSEKFRHGLRDVADMLSALRDPSAWQHPANTIARYSDLALARRSFGDTVIRDILARRRQLAARYREPVDFMEQAHTIDLLTWDYEAAVFEHHLCLAHGRQKRYPFLDESLIRLAYGIESRHRYIRGTQSKYLLKNILRHHGLSEIANSPKRGGTFETDLFSWMKSGPLRDRVQAIKRPAYLSQRDFQTLLEHPSPTLWAILTWDIFQERVITKSVASDAEPR